MSYVERCICIYVALLMMIMCIGIASGRSSHRHRHRDFTKVSTVASNSWTIVVDKSGNGNFTTIQSAIDAVPSNNRNWVMIYIKAGYYNEQVKIPMDKPMIYLKGEGIKKTNVVWGDADIRYGATLLSDADNIVARSISFTNSYNYPPQPQSQPQDSGNPIMPAAAAMINGDKSAFYDCGFLGVQDTIWDNNGRHYFKGCAIEGAVDFIMGAGQSIYEGCKIVALTKRSGGGFITAQGRTDPNDTNGFVFKNCSVTGDGPVHLGRAWRGYARVLFYQCFLYNIIPQGWDAWNNKGNEGQLTFTEEGCHGPGSDTSERVSWEKMLSPEMVQQLTSMSFIDNEGWIGLQRSIMFM